MTDATVFIVPFSHLDLFWAGTRDECLARGNAIIGKALDLLERHPDFRFLIETINFLDHYLWCHPQDEARVRRLAEAGRLEIAPLWSGIYQNLPGGESLVRNILHAKRWTRARLGLESDVAHFGDLPGFTPQFPQIAAGAGIRYALLSRGGPADSPLFRWRAPDGSQITAYFVIGSYAALCTTDWHLGYEAMTAGALPRLLAEAAANPAIPGLRHWGSDLYAPHENVILNARRWNAERQPQVRFTTVHDYFAAVDATPGLPVLGGEVPSVWPNIESSWPDLWPEDLPCEAALRLAEFLAAAGRLHGCRDLPRAELAQAWTSLLDGMDHNQNGQGGRLADADKLQLKKHARALAERTIRRMAARLGAAIRSPFPDAIPVTVFNPLSWRRDGIASVRLSAYGEVRPEDLPAWRAGFRLVDAEGRDVPFAVLVQTEGVSIGLEIAFRARDVPSLGWATWWMVPGGADAAASARTTTLVRMDEVPGQEPRRNLGRHLIRTARLQLAIDAMTGEIDLDAADGTPLLRRMRLLAVEERRGNYISDMTPSGRDFPAILDAVEVIDDNALWCRVRLRGTIYGMGWTQVITLLPDSDEVIIDDEIDWREPRWVRIQHLFPWAGPGDQVRYGVPFGSVRFPDTMTGATAPNADEIPAEIAANLRLAQQWIDIGDADAGLTIAADHRMWEFDGATMRSYLIRGAGYCRGIERDADGHPRNIARPPAGTYRFRYVLRPRRASLAASASYRCGWELGNPLHAVSTSGSRPGADGPDRASLFDGTATPLVATAVKPAEDGDAIVARFFDAGGEGHDPGPLVLAGIAARRCDLLERGREAPAPIPAHGIATLVWDLPA